MIPDIYYINSENEKIDLLDLRIFCRRGRSWTRNGSTRAKKHRMEAK